MTEQEAAEKLGALLNEIEEAGHLVHWHNESGHFEGLAIGEYLIAEPRSEGEPWEVQGP